MTQEGSIKLRILKALFYRKKHNERINLFNLHLLIIFNYGNYRKRISFQRKQFFIN
jgi:hypothetical protein